MTKGWSNNAGRRKMMRHLRLLWTKHNSSTISQFQLSILFFLTSLFCMCSNSMLCALSCPGMIQHVFEIKLLYVTRWKGMCCCCWRTLNFVRLFFVRAELQQHTKNLILKDFSIFILSLRCASCFHAFQSCLQATHIQNITFFHSAFDRLFGKQFFWSPFRLDFVLDCQLQWLKFIYNLAHMERGCQHRNAQASTHKKRVHKQTSHKKVSKMHFP